MTDKVLAISEQKYGVGKTQDWQMTDRVNQRLMFLYLLRSSYDCNYNCSLQTITNGIFSEFAKTMSVFFQASFSRRRNFVQSLLNVCPSFSSTAFSEPPSIFRHLQSCIFQTHSFLSAIFRSCIFSVAFVSIVCSYSSLLRVGVDLSWTCCTTCCCQFVGRNPQYMHFYPRDAMLARVLAMVLCLTVCPPVSVSVCHKSVFYRNG